MLKDNELMEVDKFKLDLDKNQKIVELKLKHLQMMTEPKNFERLEKLLELTKEQYLTVWQFENFYLKRQNQGIKSIERQF